MTDHASFVVLPGLVRRISEAAPMSRLEAVASHDRRLADVASGKLELVLDAAGAPAELQSESSSPTSSLASSPITRCECGD